MAEYTQTYWDDLIEKYRKGTISKEERYALEKKALDDPFLFDALEGFALYNENNESRKEKRKIFTLPNLAAAASILLLIAVMFNLRTNKESAMESNEQIAMVMEDEESKQPIISKSEEIEDKKGMPAAQSPEGKDGAEGESNADDEIAASQNPTQERKPSIKEKEDNSAVAFQKVGDVNEAAGTQQKMKDEAVAETLIDKPVNTVIDGVAVDSDIVEEEDKIESIATAGEKMNKQEEGAVLMENVAEEEGSGNAFTSKEEKRKKATTYFEAEPVIGKKIFDDYAKERIDERGLRQAKPQEVTIEFSIDKEGNLSNFHHIFTGCSECGPFAISLLQNSGVWKTIPPGYSGKARYTFKF